jgi:DNA primase
MFIFQKQKKVKFKMSILDYIDIKFLINSLNLDMKEHHNYFLGKCIFHQDNKPSFSIHKDGYFRCFSCGAQGSLAKLVYKLTGKSIYKFFNITDINSFHFENSIKNKKDDKQRASFDIKDIEIKGNLLDIKDSKDEKLLEYVNKRNLSNYFIDYFDIKYCTYCKVNNIEFRNRLMIPIYNDGRLTGYEGRDFTKLQKPKVLYSKGTDVSTLFNFDNLNRDETLILVEGVMDLPLIFTEITENVTCLFGAVITNKQKKLLNEFKKDIVYFQDNDEAGDNSVKELDSFLEKEFYIAKSEKKGQDPGDLKLEELRSCLNNKIKSIDYFLDKSNLFYKEEVTWC